MLSINNSKCNNQKLNNQSKDYLIRNFIDTNNIKEIINFTITESIEELSKLRLGDNSMTFFHKIVFNMNYTLFNEVLQSLENRITKKELSTMLNLTDVDGNTPIHYAAYNGSIDIIRSLLINGSNHNATTNKGLTVMHMAAQGNQPHIIIFFKEQLGMSLYETDDNGSTPLHWACYSSAENSVNYLLALDANINSQDYTGQTALHIAIFTENISIIKALLLKQPDLTIKNNDGRTVIDLSKKAINSKGIKSLLRSSINIKHCCSNSNTNSNSSCYNSPYAFILLFCALIAIVYYFLLFYMDIMYTRILFGLIIMILISFGYVCYSNPGFSEEKYHKSWIEIVNCNIKLDTLCPYCKVNLHKLTRHCAQCNHCVKERFHHCNWINNCVGDGNYKQYLLFLGILLCGIGYIYAISMKVFLTDASIGGDHETLIFSIPHLVWLKKGVAVLVILISLSFFLIIAYVFCKQVRKQLIHQKKKRI